MLHDNSRYLLVLGKMLGRFAMSSRRVESFLVRLVVEGGDAPDPAWRGRIQHVSSGGEQQFERIQEMLAFISNQLIHDQSKVLAFEQLLNAD
jgi:hypothetical protein